MTNKIDDADKNLCGFFRLLFKVDQRNKRALRQKQEEAAIAKDDAHIAEHNNE